jgi:hypothetical protein
LFYTDFDSLMNLPAGKENLKKEQNTQRLFQLRCPERGTSDGERQLETFVGQYTDLTPFKRF